MRNFFVLVLGLLICAVPVIFVWWLLGPIGFWQNVGAFFVCLVVMKVWFTILYVWSKP